MDIKTTFCSIFLILSILFLGACGPSQDGIDATSTRGAAANFAAQTAEAATATPLPSKTPTSTPSPTNTYTITPTPTLGTGSTLVSPIDGMTMVFVPAGEFIMGSTEDDSHAKENEYPKHSIDLDDYWIDQTEVTNSMFAAFVDSTGYETDAKIKGFSHTFQDGGFEEVDGLSWQNPGGLGSKLIGIENHPVVHVSWNDASAYCDWAGRRLPTEAEWEKAARGEDDRIYPWGDGFDCNYGNFDGEFCDGYTGTAPVGSFMEGASLFGALDMAGNVWEWVADWYDREYYSNSPDNNPSGPESGKHRVQRGGGWHDKDEDVRSAFRETMPPDLALDDLGFRCALSVKPPNPTPTPTPTPTALAYGGLITFTSDRDGPLGIYIINADGTGNAELLTIHPYHETHPAWSPSGEQIAFVSARDLDPDSPVDPIEIYVINSDGSGLTRLTKNPQNFFPAWSPDHLRIAFETNRDGNNEIYVMNADGSGVARLTDNPASDDYPSWSPDGSQISFHSDRDCDLEIYVMDANGSNVIQLTENTALDAGSAWSPDGKQIAFQSDRDGNLEIYVMNADGSEVIRLTNDPAFDGQPSWSHDGRHITFVSNRDGNLEIYAMNAYGSSVTRLTEDPASDQNPNWSPLGVELSTKPWFGTPWCSRDTNGDMQPDTPTIKFKSNDVFAYIMFPFRNMKDGIEWSHNWIGENGMSMNNFGWWDSGESGFHTAMFSAPTFGSGMLTIQLVIEGEIVREIQCEIVK